MLLATGFAQVEVGPRFELPARGPGHIINPASPEDVARASDYLVW